MGEYLLDVPMVCSVMFCCVRYRNRREIWKRLWKKNWLIALYLIHVIQINPLNYCVTTKTQRLYFLITFRQKKKKNCARNRNYDASSDPRDPSYVYLKSTVTRTFLNRVIKLSPSIFTRRRNKPRTPTKRLGKLAWDDILSRWDNQTFTNYSLWISHDLTPTVSYFSLL